MGQPDFSTCPYCFRFVDPTFFGDNAYPYPQDFGPRIVCVPCKAHVGCHYRNLLRPLGAVAKAEDREKRKQVHSLIDPLWEWLMRYKKKRKGKARDQVYQELSALFGREAHASWETGEELDRLLGCALELSNHYRQRRGFQA